MPFIEKVSVEEPFANHTKTNAEKSKIADAVVVL